MRADRLERSIAQLRQFRDEVEGLNSWMREVDAFVREEEAAIGDTATLEAQIEQSVALQEGTYNTL